MRLAVIADIHGNLLAFEAVLADIRKQGVDAIVIAGDIVVGCPDTNACWDLATSLGVPIIRGNHERYFFDFGTERASPEWSERRFLPVAWAVERAGDARRAAAQALPMTHVPDGFDDNVLIVHASPRSDCDTITAHTSDADLDAMFAGEPRPTIVRGHNHNPRTDVSDTRTIITVGACGLPLDGKTIAQYAILERDASRRIYVDQRFVEYDVGAALRRFHDTGYLAATGPMGLMFYRELATATYHMLPLLSWWKKWNAERPMTIDEACERFMTRL